MKASLLVAALGAIAPGCYALIRFPCSQLVTERLDPLVTPGQVSPHVHQIIGGNAFNITMDPEVDLSVAATCTTCKFKEDKSNYWTAVMYFKHPNGSFIRVPQKPNHLTGNPDGGMTVYYIQPPDLSPTVAFAKGFRMITGNPMRRRDTYLDPTSPEAWSLSFRCYETPGFFDYSNGYPPGAGPYDTVELPKKKCPYGIRANIFFPSCWDGVNLDTPDHHSHVAFMEGKVNPNMGIILMNGACPASHPVRIPMLFYETLWDTAQFSDLWTEDGETQPFVLSQGDPTGYGHHGDYVFGWEGDSLQRAMDKCGADYLGLPDSCPELTQISDEEMNSCKQETRVDEVVEGVYLKELPGCNPIQDGPGQATMIPHCTAISTTGKATPTPASPLAHAPAAVITP